MQMARGSSTKNVKNTETWWNQRGNCCTNQPPQDGSGAVSEKEGVGRGRGGRGGRGGQRDQRRKKRGRARGAGGRGAGAGAPPPRRAARRRPPPHPDELPPLPGRSVTADIAPLEHL